MEEQTRHNLVYETDQKDVTAFEISGINENVRPQAPLLPSGASKLGYYYPKMDKTDSRRYTILNSYVFSKGEEPTVLQSAQESREIPPSDASHFSDNVFSNKSNGSNEISHAESISPLTRLYADPSERKNDLEPLNDMETEETDQKQGWKDFEEVGQILSDNFGSSSSAYQIKLSRTQQKALDMKKLANEETPLSQKQSFHNIKIQHDTIMNQYSSIRSRFAGNYALNPNKNIGVLGYINRLSRQPQEEQKDQSQIIGELTSENKGTYLRRIWEKEMDAIFDRDP